MLKDKNKSKKEEIITRPRLHKLTIKNFRAIGKKPVTIDLDEIVVLVGPNNAGKSSILKAYELIMSEGSKNAEITIDDFPNKIVDKDNLPEIELFSIVNSLNSPGSKWINRSTGEMIVRERWIWTAPGKPIRQGFDTEINDWRKEVPWGAANVANSRRPEPHRVDAFEDPENQAKSLVKILETILKDKVNEVTEKMESDGSDNEYSSLLEQIKSIQKRIVSESESQINSVEMELTNSIKGVFPGYVVNFDAKPEENLQHTISFFKASPQLLMGPENGFKSDIGRQGSGARRTLLWAALRFISENGYHKKPKERESSLKRSNILLIDEPELCLHPSAIREACKVLYDLPKSKNWQVMVTTHSPSFIDLSRDNTTIIRVERTLEGEIQGTTLFRPDTVRLDDDDRRLLKLLNQFDPYVAEFFFGGHTIIVEGDTEYTAFKHIIHNEPEFFKNIHIIRARGKATIASLVKILNHFNTCYSVLHDSDTPLNKNNGKSAAWGTNNRILGAVQQHPRPGKVKLVCSIKNFEAAFLSKEVTSEKPYNALMELTRDDVVYQNIRTLLHSLYDHSQKLPTGAIEWDDISQLEEVIK
ncbi:AAA family ATPase (plasmid) [Bacillus carboniphilus]|uniref:AAA family ATPase n=1 Tax=Bacillus carboniphilus TaxID=86663 RepID=A0ABY9K030_9BACI|nr:AAA family ATPase [Bacillus carboniphilus]WLR44393.1 AAA family ATPase [Bacillus carboniphilus]